MSVLARLGQRLPASRRAYSFFSSNGRYYKPTGIVAAGPNSSDGRKPPAPGAPKAVASTVAKPDIAATPDAAVAPEPSVSPAPAPAQPFAWHAFTPVQHPAPSAQDIRLHQFFSLHRPLLNLAQPGASVFESAPDVPANWTEARRDSEAVEYALDSADADAHAARQLARAIVMNRVGADISFDAALRRLGLDVSEGRARAEDVDLSDLTIHLDSTKRKRRKKMKKHKYVYLLSSYHIPSDWPCRLKKRRKAQRSERMRLK
jgi:hypothetical protein